MLYIGFSESFSIVDHSKVRKTILMLLSNEHRRTGSFIFPSKHKRYLPPQGDFKGGLVNSEAPMQVTEVSLVDPSDG